MAKRGEKRIDGLRMHVPRLIEARELNPSAYNPNKMTPPKFEALKESIRKNGFIEPIVVQEKGLNIVGGHHRLKAIKELCVELGIQVPAIPCNVLDIDDVEAKKLNLKLNHIHGEPDAHLLGELLVDLFPSPVRLLPSLESDVLDLGMDLDDVTKHIRLVEPEAFPVLSGDVDSKGGYGKSLTLSIEFTNVDARNRVKKLLQERVQLEKKKSGEIVAALLSPRKAKKKAA